MNFEQTESCHHPTNILFVCLFRLIRLFFFHCESLSCLQLCGVFVGVWHAYYPLLQPSDPSAAGLQWSSPIWAPWHSDYPLTCKHTATIWSCPPCLWSQEDHNHSSLRGPLAGLLSGLHVQIKSRDPIPPTFRWSDTQQYIFQEPVTRLLPPRSFHPKLETSLARRLEKCLISICQENSWHTMPSCSFMP